ncbi:MAG: hypothetical protein P8Y95_18270 [Gammaproteobacteria bacterium]
MRFPLFVFLTIALAAQAAETDDYTALWGPAIGTEIPMLEPVDVSGRSRSLDDLAGEKGLLLFFNRSADW